MQELIKEIEIKIKFWQIVKTWFCYLDGKLEIYELKLEKVCLSNF